MQNNKISIVGIVGVPANYGGFETLAENLIRYHNASSLSSKIAVYCSSSSYPLKAPTFLSAKLQYIPLNANGIQSIAYDFVALFISVWNRSDAILLLGVSGAIALPLVRFFSSARIVTNIDGIEWRREKWQGWIKCFLRFSEKMAIRFSHEIIADNEGIAEYVVAAYGVKCHVIPYGGDHAKAVDDAGLNEYDVPESFAFSVCRIEPENNVHMILNAFSEMKSKALVVVGNWNSSEYGLDLRKKFSSFSNIFMLDPIYDLGKLKYLRTRALFFIHGHSAGGTNPSLVEAMHFGKAIFAYDCNYNHYTTENKAKYFKNSEELVHMIEIFDDAKEMVVGRDMVEIAERRYTWSVVARQYFALLGD